MLTAVAATASGTPTYSDRSDSIEGPRTSDVSKNLLIDFVTLTDPLVV